MLQPEQIEQIKKQILQQIEANFPEDKKNFAKEQIELMDEEQLEEFLKQNNLINDKTSEQQCIFCSIADGKISSHKIDENQEAVAVLEINPISQGHTLIIPKKHLNKIPTVILTFAKKVEKKIKTKLKPAKIEISQSELSGHKILNILPVYKSETFNSKRYQAKSEELEKIKNQLEEKPKKKIIRKPKTEKISEENIWLPKRIP